MSSASPQSGSTSCASRSLTESARKDLLRIARTSIESHVRKSDRPHFEVADPILRENRGVFVTLKKQGALRGCIGYPDPIKPLWEAVASAAVSAATEDPRFPPVSANELKEITIDISVLGPLERVNSTDQIIIGTHGLVIQDRGHRGLLLPQVATEYGMDRQEFLEHTCLKAGLARNAWEESAEIYRFTAEVFGE